MFCQTLCRGQNLRILPCPFSHCLQNVWQTPRQNYRSKRCHLGNVLKSATLLSATTECHSQNWERRRSATPFYQKERCGSGTHIFEESENMSGPLLSLFFFLKFSFFWHSFSVNKLVSQSLLCCGLHIFGSKGTFNVICLIDYWHKISVKFSNSSMRKKSWNNL